MEPTDNNNGLYTEKENIALQSYKDKRDAMINVMFKGGTPEDNRDIRLVNELLIAAEASIHKTAENRARQQEATAKEAIAEMVAETLKSQFAREAAIPVTARTLEVGVDLSPEEIVPGEMDINPEPLDPELFLSSRTE